MGLLVRAGILALLIAVLLCLSLATAMPGMDVSRALTMCCALAIVVLIRAASSLWVPRTVLGAIPYSRCHSPHRPDLSLFWPRPPDRVSLRSLLI